MSRPGQPRGIGFGLLPNSWSGLLQQCTLRQMVKESKTPGIEPSRHAEILDIILANIR
jgi:hypothetical protein